MKDSDALQNFIDLNCQTIHDLLHVKGLTIGTFEILFQHFASKKIDFDDSEIACSKGCGYCCYLRVTASLPEIFVILKYLEKSKQLAHFSEKAKRLKTPAPDQVSSDPAWWVEHRIPCLFFDEEQHLCTIYEVRPFTCRGYHSLDRKRCQDGYLQKTIVKIPCYPNLKNMWQAYSKSFVKTVQQRGKQNGHLELSSSVAHFLENYYLVSAWFTDDK